MRRFSALLIAGLVAVPLGAAAGPSPERRTDGPVIEKFEWSNAKPRLGVAVLQLTPELRTHFGAPDHSGVLVARVEAGSPAAKAGVQVGDVLVDVRGHSIDDAGDVRSALAAVGKGQTASIKLVRERKQLTLTATITSDAPASWIEPDPSAMQWFRDLMMRFRPRDGSTHT
jgi:membrane-associated protease RseP (regulator of RpoE activity)